MLPPKTNDKHHNKNDWSKNTNPVSNAETRAHAAQSSNSKHNRRVCSPPSNPPTYAHELGGQKRKPPLMFWPQRRNEFECIQGRDRNAGVQTLQGAWCGGHSSNDCFAISGRTCGSRRQKTISDCAIAVQGLATSTAESRSIRFVAIQRLLKAWKEAWQFQCGEKHGELKRSTIVRDHN